MSKVFIGTSGWAYSSWKPKFYPPEVRSADFLKHYAGRLDAIEVNYTFNRLPTEKSIGDWTAATPSEFTFALKASQRITHIDRLAHPADTLPLFWEKVRPLGSRLGPVLFQTPPWIRRNDDLLAGFVAELPREQRCVLEVRDASWYVPEVYEILSLAGVALCHAEGEKAPSPLETVGVTADFAYLRLRAEAGYDDKAVAAWAERAGSLLAAGRDVYVFFKHDDDGSNGLAAEKLRAALA